MKIEKIMHVGVETVPATISVREAARFMKTFGRGGLPVATDDEVVGFVTDRDIVVRCLAEGKDPAETKVESVMTPKPLAVYAEQTVEDAVETMIGHAVRRLIVLDSEGQPKGLVTVEELAGVDDGGCYAERVLRQVS
jgi:CBS domain-containing protein